MTHSCKARKECQSREGKGTQGNLAFWLECASPMVSQFKGHLLRFFLVLPFLPSGTAFLKFGELRMKQWACEELNKKLRKYTHVHTLKDSNKYAISMLGITHTQE